MIRAEYPIHPGIKLNDSVYKRVIIDGHYKEKHSPPMTDQLILEICHHISGEVVAVDSKKGEFEFYVIEKISYKKRLYRLILVIDTTDNFLGVVNAFPVGKGK